MQNYTVRCETGNVVAVPEAGSNVVSESGPRSGFCAIVSGAFLEASRQRGGVLTRVDLIYDPANDVGLAVIILVSGDEIHSIVIDPLAPELGEVRKAVERGEWVGVVCCAPATRETRVVCIANDEWRAVAAFWHGKERQDGEDVRRTFVDAGFQMLNDMHAHGESTPGAFRTFVLQAVGIAMDRGGRSFAVPAGKLTH